MRTQGNGNARNTEHTTNIANSKNSRHNINNAKSDGMRHPGNAQKSNGILQTIEIMMVTIDQVIIGIHQSDLVEQEIGQQK